MNTGKKGIIAVLTALMIFCTSAPTMAAYDYDDAADEFRDMLEFIDSVYYYRDDLDYKELVDDALISVFDNLDKYSNYLTMEEYNSFMQYAETNKSGIGVLMRKTGNGYAEVLKVYKDSPAEKAGIVKGDVIIKIEETDVRDKSLEEMRQLIIGTKGTDVKLTLTRNGETIEITATRGTFNAPLAERTDISELLEGADDSKTAYVEITSFAHNEENPINDTARQFLKIYNDLKKENIENLIIDIRDNSGGDVAALIEIAEVLVRRGVMFSFKYNSGAPDTYRSTSNTAPEFNVAVLVNENTASSSEILASAIKESNSGFIVGTNTYGKGVGQIPAPAVDGKHMMLLTVTEIISRNGNSINGVGVAPDIYIEPAPWIVGVSEVNGRSEAEDIASIKKALTFLGFDAGQDALYDEKLTEAIKSFQKSIGLEQTGVCDEALISQINSHIADKAQHDDTALKRAYEELNK